MSSKCLMDDDHPCGFGNKRIIARDPLLDFEIRYPASHVQTRICMSKSKRGN